MVRFDSAIPGAALVVAAVACTTTSAFAPPCVPVRTSNASPVSRPATALNMNLFDRFTRVAKASINDVLKRLEDPEKIMNQAVEDMQVRNNTE
jgi:hypothetical protein